MTGGYGRVVYTKAIRFPAAVGQGLRRIRKLGTSVVSGEFREPTRVYWTIIGDAGDPNVRGSDPGPCRHPVAIRMLEKHRQNKVEIVAHRLPPGRFDGAFG